MGGGGGGSSRSISGGGGSGGREEAGECGVLAVLWNSHQKQFRPC